MKITSSQVHWFRLRRSGLIEPFASPEETARRLIGVQAQLMTAADLAFWNRTANCTAQVLREARLEQKTIVRFWGQRDTLHIFDTSDWPLLHTIFAPRVPRTFDRLEKSNVFADFQKLVKQTAARLAKGKPLAYKDIRSKTVENGIRMPQMNDTQARWAVAYITFRQLVREGIACHGPDEGSESRFVHRESWLPKMKWSPPAPKKSFAEIAVRYLSAYGPAEPRDLAHWYGTTVTKATKWIESTGERCQAIDIDSRTFFYNRDDAEELNVKPPPPSDWPVRLLYHFDPMVLGTKDKWWLIDEAHYKKVWRGSAHVNAVVLVRGRISGTWRYERKSKGLRVQVQPFDKFSKTVQRAIEKQANCLADFLDSPLADFQIAKT